MRIAIMRQFLASNDNRPKDGTPAKENKAKSKGQYQGKNRLTPEELESYKRQNCCFRCGEKGHSYRACPQKKDSNDNKKEPPRASQVDTKKEEACPKGSTLSYAWGKVREHDALIL